MRYKDVLLRPSDKLFFFFFCAISKAKYYVIYCYICTFYLDHSLLFLTPVLHNQDQFVRQAYNRADVIHRSTQLLSLKQWAHMRIWFHSKPPLFSMCTSTPFMTSVRTWNPSSVISAEDICLSFTINTSTSKVMLILRGTFWVFYYCHVNNDWTQSNSQKNVCGLCLIPWNWLGYFWLDEVINTHRVQVNAFKLLGYPTVITLFMDNVWSLWEIELYFWNRSV